MKATGIVRRIDDLGPCCNSKKRFVELCVSEKEILLKFLKYRWRRYFLEKYSVGELSSFAEQYAEVLLAKQPMCLF